MNPFTDLKNMTSSIEVFLYGIFLGGVLIMGIFRFIPTRKDILAIREDLETKADKDELHNFVEQVKETNESLKKISEQLGEWILRQAIYEEKLKNILNK